MNNTVVKTQRNAILKYLKGKRKLTSAKAYALFGTLKLPTRCSELLDQGVPIVKERIKVTNRYGKKVTVMQYSI